MKRRDPPDVAILAARLMRAWPSLSPYSAASLAVELCAIERAQRRHAERQCSGEDGGYVRRGGVAWLGTSRAGRPSLEHDPEAEQRAGARVWGRVSDWILRAGTLAGFHPAQSQEAPTIDLQNDPRGRVLLLRLPGEQEASTV